MTFEIREDWMIPVAPGHSVVAGWRDVTDRKPMGVTWHWTAGWTLDQCSRTLGGGNAAMKGISSAHYGIGRSFEEGVDRYVSLENQSWHAGKEQKLRWDGKKSTNATKGSRTTVGVETVNIGFAREGVPAAADWIEVTDTNCRWPMRIQPWPEEQFEMMVAIGKEIVARWPHIGHRAHHGHHDICPGYKQDVAGMDFARLLRRIYDDDTIPDVWTPLRSPKARQSALINLGYDLGHWGADGDFGDRSMAALDKFQKDRGAVRIGFWTSFTNWDVWDECRSRGLDFAEVTRPPR